MDKIFDKEKFEKITQNKIDNIENINELIYRRNFVEQVKKIYRKNPFCYVPYFVRKFFNGDAVNELQELFHFSNSLELYNITKNILEFKQDRYRYAQYGNAFELNLKVSSWKEKYELFEDNFNYFENEIDELFFENILQSFIILSLMDKPLTKEELFEKCFELKNNYDIYHFIDEKLRTKFNSFFNSQLKNRFEEILFELISQKIIHTIHSDVKRLKITLTIDEMKKNIKNLVQVYHGKSTFGSLKTQINQEYPSLKLIPGLGIFEVAIFELNAENYIHLESRSSRKNDYQIFLSDDFQKIENNIKLLENTGHIPFKGRKITPETFILELLELEKGDFGDGDDQVTRLAGLVLAESVTLQSTPENIPEFDFTINLANYRFRPDQLNAMDKLNFKIDSELFHIKVMINDTLNLKKYQSLREKIPVNEQGVIVTFKKIPLDVKKKLENDSTIQAIDEDGIKIWVSISSRLPARVNSISKISFDPLSHLENNIVKVNSVMYEKGIALVTILSELKEIPVLVRSLEEISISKYNPKKFESYSKKYLDFLHKLSELSPNTFDDGMFTEIIKVYSNRMDLMRDLNPRLYADGYKGNYDETSSPKHTRYIRFENVYSTIDIDAHRSNITCTCNHQLNEEYRRTLCKHLVASINHIYKETLDEGKEGNKIQTLEKYLLEFQEDNIRRMIQAIDDVISVEDGEDIFRNYLKAYV